MSIKTISAILISMFMGLTNFTTEVNSKYKISKIDKQFLEFLSQFPIATAPFEIEINDLAKYRATYKKLNNKYIKSDFVSRDLANKYLRGKIKISKRFAPAPILPVSRFYVDDNHVAVVFATIPFRGVEKQLHVHLKVFDLYGNSVMNEDKSIVTIASSTPETTETVYFTNSKQYSVETKKNIWKDGYANHDLPNNCITRYEPESISHTSMYNLIKKSSQNKTSIVSLNP